MPISRSRRLFSQVNRCLLYSWQLLIMQRSGNLLRNRSYSNLRLHLNISGTKNKIIIGNKAKGKLAITIRGNGNSIFVGHDTRFFDGPTTIMMQCNASAFRFGHGSTTQGTLFHFAEDQTSISVGRDCMFADETDIWVTDFHSIIDRTTGQRLNRAKRIDIEDHVWIGLGSRVLKNVRIGTNSIVGTGSVVTRNVTPHTIALGVPAKDVKVDVSWNRQRL